MPEVAGSQDYVLVFEEPVTAWAKVAAEEAVLKGGRRLLTADVSHLGPAVPVVVKTEGREAHRGALATGHTRIDVGVPEGVTGSVRVAIEAAGRTLLDEAVPLRPVATRELHVIPHSHVDIGYSDPQPEVERKQWANFRDALALFEKTKDMPPEARFRWEAEGLWAVESFLAQATEAERRAFAEAVKRGDLELPANLTNLLTGLCHPEELARWTDASRRLKRLYGIETAPVAMHTDIPGLAWPTVSALAQAGVRYFSSGPNYMPNLKPDGGDRIGGTLVEHGDRPFWWVSPSGRERLLMWVAGRGYSWFHGGYVGRVSDAATRGILDYARELTERGYPYELVQVRYTVGGDNGPVDPKLPEFVAEWNARYETPRLVIDSAQGLFEAFERRYGASLPEKRGDLTPYWEDGALSSAGEEILARAAARRLVQAEALWGMADGTGFPRDRFEEAWRQVLLWHEHTWGAAASISEPDRPDVVAQWEYKRAFAVEADRRSRELFDEAAGRKAAPALLGVAIANTLGRPRGGLVVLPAGRSRAGERVTDSAGHVLPSQRLADGALAVAVPEVPGRGLATLAVTAGPPPPVTGRATASGTTLENDALRVELDPATGAIRRLLDRARGVELAGPQGLARYRYVPGRDPALAQDAGPVTITVEENGTARGGLASRGPGPGRAQRRSPLPPRRRTGPPRGRAPPRQAPGPREGERPPHLRPRGRGRRPPDRPGHESHGPGEGRPSRFLPRLRGGAQRPRRRGPEGRRRPRRPRQPARGARDDGGRAAEPGRDPPLEAGALRGHHRARVPPQQLLAHELQGRPAGPAPLPLRAPAARRRAAPRRDGPEPRPGAAARRPAGGALGPQAPLFLSSQVFGSQSSTLFPSGSMIHANLPFSCDSGPWMTSTPPARSCSSSSPRLSTR